MVVVVTYVKWYYERWFKKKGFLTISAHLEMGKKFLAGIIIDIPWLTHCYFCFAGFANVKFSYEYKTRFNAKWQVFLCSVWTNQYVFLSCGVENLQEHKLKYCVPFYTVTIPIYKDEPIIKMLIIYGYLN